MNEPKSKFKLCRKCGLKFKPTLSPEELCISCRDTLPKCFACGIIVAPEWDYQEKGQVKIGDKEICRTCYSWLQKWGVLHLSGKRDMLPNGTIVASSVFGTARG